MYFNFAKKNKFIILIFVFSLLARLITIFLFGDEILDNEWWILYENYKNFGILGINVFNGNEVVAKIASQTDNVLPSVFMPPFYLFFIIFFGLFFKSKLLVISILIFQSFFYIISAYFFYRFLRDFFCKEISYLGLIIFLYFPLSIYASTQISSITLQVSFISLFFYFFNKIIKKKNIKNFFLFSLTSSILILLRGEFLLILFFTYIFIILNVNDYKKIILSCCLILIFVSPYLIRNYLIFDKILITKSLGYNLWKGSNDFSRVDGNNKLNDNYLINSIKNIEPDKFYELRIDDIYKKEALEIILNNPKEYITLYIKKFFAFLFFDNNQSYPNYNHILHLFPKLLIGVLSFFGIILVFLEKNKKLIYYGLCFLLNASVFSAFFILPRYQLGVLSIQIIMVCFFLEKIFFKFKKKS